MKQHRKFLRPEKSAAGFSLIELLIYIVLLGILMVLVFSTFIPVMQSGSRQWRIGETKIETGVGLNLLRTDLDHAGFGLPWEFPVGVTPSPYFEPAAPAALADAPGAPNADPLNVPRALASEDNSALSLNNADYLTIKAMNVVFGTAGQKWGWLGRQGDVNHTPLLQPLSNDALVSTDRVIVIRPEVSAGEYRQLVLDGTNYFAHYTVADLTPFAPPPTPNDPNGARYLIYGIDGNNDPRRPFNRTDYYINAPTAANPQSAQCAPGTGTLVKATLNQANDNFTISPIVDCVADFQVVYYLDTNGDGGGDTIANASGLNGLTAQQVREQVKSVRCYILTHEGGVDQTYTYPNVNINVGELDPNGVPVLAVDGTPAGRVLTPNDMTNICPTWRNYRWKVYSVSVTPQNLQ